MIFQGDLYQIGVVVRDIDRGMEQYRQLLGLGPFWRLDTDYEGRYRDWRGRFANRNAFTRWGNLYLEMIEPVTGEGNAREWLETRGEGISTWAMRSMISASGPTALRACSKAGAPRCRTAMPR